MKIPSITILAILLTSTLSADYASEYRDLWNKWKAADDAFKAHTKNLKPGKPSEELKAESDALGVELFRARRSHPALADQNAMIESLQDSLEDAIREKDSAKQDEVKDKIKAAIHELGEQAKSVPDLVELEQKRILAMTAVNESRWAFDKKALKLYRESENLKREIAELRAANGQ